jgi:cell division septation protein DedD
MPNTPPPVREGEADEDILSICQEDFLPAQAPATHPQVLDELFTPPAFLLARDVRREVKDLALHAPAQAPAPQAEPARFVETIHNSAPVEPERGLAPVASAVESAPDAAPIVNRAKPVNTAKPVSEAGTSAAELMNEAQPINEARPEPEPSREPASASEVNKPRAAAARAAEPGGKRPEAGPESARKAQPAPRLDNYAVGLRLLRISPAWLVLSSIGFFLLLFLLSWLYQPASQPETLIVAAAAGQNHSVNGSTAAPASVVAPTVIVPAAETAVPSSAGPAESSSAEPVAAAPAVKGSQATTPATAAVPAPAAQPEPEAPASAASPSAPTGRFAVQVGSYNNSSEANERVSKLRASGFTARAAAVDLPQRGIWHRVYVGGFDTREEAARHANELRAKGVAPTGLVVEVK